jgi:hypothetical protein
MLISFLLWNKAVVAVAVYVFISRRDAESQRECRIKKVIRFPLTLSFLLCCLCGSA